MRRSLAGCQCAQPSDWNFCEPGKEWLYLASGREVAEIERQLWVIGFEPMPMGGEAGHSFPVEEAGGVTKPDLLAGLWREAYRGAYHMSGWTAGEACSSPVSPATPG